MSVSYSILMSGGQTSTANLFYNLSAHRVGLVGHWDCVAFDEVAGMHFRDMDAIQILKDYMASGSFARGRNMINADASIVYIGNINDSVESLLKVARLQTCNKDISFWELDRLARKIYQLSAVDYLVRNGILEEPKSAPRDSELHEITQVLKQRYSQSKAKSYSQLKKDNPDIKYGTVEKWIKNATGKSPTEYYVSEGIVEAPDVPFENGYQYVVYNHTSKTIERGKSYFPLLSDNLIREIQNAPDFCKDERSAFIIRYSGSDSNVVVPRTIGDAVVRYVGGFISNRDVQTITIPNTVVRLNGQAFNHCKKLEQVILEESSRLIFPAGVFRGCPRLNMPPKGID